MGDEIAGFFIQNGLRGGKIAEGAQEAVPVGVKAAEGGVDTVIGIVIPAFPVFGFVVNDAALHLHFANVQIPLEIGGIVHGVPQAPFHGGGESEAALSAGFVGQRHLLHLAIFLPRHQEGKGGGDAVFLRLKDGVAQAVAAAIGVQRGIAGVEGGTPGGFPSSFT